MNRWKSDAFSDLGIANQINKDIKHKLHYNYHPLFDWRPEPNTVYPTIEINKFGLRSNNCQIQSGDKKKCLLLGGSFAWGFGASSNDFIPSYLIEKILLETYQKKIAVINLADQMYSSTQEIKSFVFSVDELKPNIVLCVSGHNDIGAGFRNLYKNHIKYNQFTDFFQWGIKTGLINETSYWKKWIKFIFKGYIQSKKKNGDITFTNPGQEDIPYDLYRSKMDIINSICKTKNIKVVHVLQPVLYLKQILSEYEKQYLSFTDENRCNYFKRQFGILQRKIWNKSSFERENAFYIDTTGYFDQMRDTIFFDTAHITDYGYKIWSERLCREMKNFQIF